MTWDGKERRGMGDQKDHDLLTRIDVNLTSFMERFASHETKDDKRFNYLEKLAYGGVGVFVFIEVVSKFIK